MMFGLEAATANNVAKWRKQWGRRTDRARYLTPGDNETLE